MDVDDAVKLLGKWGKWQLLFYILLSISNTFPASWHMLAIVFIGKFTSFQFILHFHKKQQHTVIRVYRYHIIDQVTENDSMLWYFLQLSFQYSTFCGYNRLDELAGKCEWAVHVCVVSVHVYSVGGGEVYILCHWSDSVSNYEVAFTFNLR